MLDISLGEALVLGPLICFLTPVLMRSRRALMIAGLALGAALGALWALVLVEWAEVDARNSLAWGFGALVLIYATIALASGVLARALGLAWRARGASRVQALVVDAAGLALCAGLIMAATVVL